MKNYFSLLTVLCFSGSLFAQTFLNTNSATGWKATNNTGCNMDPLASEIITGFSYTNQAAVLCGDYSVTGNSKLRITNCSNRPDQETHVFRNTYNLNSPPCLITYNLTADNAFRIYVNGVNSPTNILAGADGVCGDDYSGNNWTTAFPGILNNADFTNGINNLYFETQNGTESGEPHPFWLSGSLLLWQLSDLNSSFNNNFSYNPVTGLLTLTYLTTPQTNGAFYSLVVEKSNSYPTNPIWTPFFSRASTTLKDFKINLCPPVPIICDANGAAVRITFTAMAGACQTTTSYLWSCSHGLGEGPNEQIVETTSTSDNPNFVLTSDQIKDIHDQFNEKLTADNNLKFSLDSLFATAEGQSTIQVFPNPSNGHIWVKAAAREDDLTPIKIFNQLGGLVFEGRIQGRQELDLSELPDGLYFLKTFGEKSSDLKSTPFILRR